MFYYPQLIILVSFGGKAFCAVVQGYNIKKFPHNFLGEILVICPMDPKDPSTNMNVLEVKLLRSKNII